MNIIIFAVSQFIVCIMLSSYLVHVADVHYVEWYALGLMLIGAILMACTTWLAGFLIVCQLKKEEVGDKLDATPDWEGMYDEKCHEILILQHKLKSAEEELQYFRGKKLNEKENRQTTAC